MAHSSRDDASLGDLVALVDTSEILEEGISRALAGSRTVEGSIDEEEWVTYEEEDNDDHSDDEANLDEDEENISDDDNNNNNNDSMSSSINCRNISENQSGSSTTAVKIKQFVHKYFLSIQTRVVEETMEYDNKLPSEYRRGTFWILSLDPFFALHNPTTEILALCEDESFDYNPVILYLPKVFLWIPHFLVDNRLKCPHPNCSGKLTSNGYRKGPPARRVVDLQSLYKCNNSHCKKSFSGHDSRIIRKLPLHLQQEFFAYLTHRSSISKDSELQKWTHARLEFQYLNCINSRRANPTMQETIDVPEFKEFSSYSDKNDYAGYSPTAQYLRVLYTVMINEIRHLIDKQMMVLEGRVLEGDHTFKIIKHLGRIGGSPTQFVPQQVYQDVLNTYNQHYLRALRNEFGQANYQPPTLTACLNYVGQNHLLVSWNSECFYSEMLFRHNELGQDAQNNNINLDTLTQQHLIQHNNLVPVLLKLSHWLLVQVHDRQDIRKWSLLPIANHQICHAHYDSVSLFHLLVEANQMEHNVPNMMHTHDGVNTITIQPFLQTIYYPSRTKEVFWRQLFNLSCLGNNQRFFTDSHEQMQRKPFVCFDYNITTDGVSASLGYVTRRTEQYPQTTQDFRTMPNGLNVLGTQNGKGINHLLRAANQELIERNNVNIQSSYDVLTQNAPTVPSSQGYFNYIGALGSVHRKHRERRERNAANRKCALDVLANYVAGGIIKSSLRKSKAERKAERRLQVRTIRESLNQLQGAHMVMLTFEHLDRDVNAACNMRQILLNYLNTLPRPPALDRGHLVVQ
ncbi:hypothetical protein INT45_005323 [Circinella minor]|uniref:DUF6729 domain-containing protein n=1 Tax=Circinella minor TaxID=1195481 RepID=A0A8H7VRW8_9FUNG|nr:hypothetical protein INT45_005323 [Circinella minor]